MVALSTVAWGVRRSPEKVRMRSVLKYTLRQNALSGACVIAKSDVRSVANQVYEAGAGEAILQHRQRIDSFAELPSPRRVRAILRVLQVSVEGVSQQRASSVSGARCGPTAVNNPGNTW